ncbi:MAG: type II toxin-antitoxin system VapC family toxin [Acidithiobacillus sp.]
MLLLDTCTLIWWLAQEDKIPPASRRHIAEDLEVCVSVITVWEILVKHANGKLVIESGSESVFNYILQQIDASDFQRIALVDTDLRHLSQLPAIHRDPFDRMLICQAIERGLTLVTPDPIIKQYPVRTLWL